jgi:hypothetical protein
MQVFDQAILAALQSSDELRRLTAGRSKGNRILNSLQNWRISQASSDRGGLLRSSRRSKSSKDCNDSSTSTSSSNTTIQQAHSTKMKETSLKRQPSIWKRFCCMT